MPTIRFLLTALALTLAISIQMGGCLSLGNNNSNNDNRDQPQPAPQPPSAQPPSGKPTAPKDPGKARDNDKAPSPEQAVSYTGLLRGGIQGIGGEHTGWQIERTGGLPPIEVNLGKVREAASKLEGRTVTVTGKMVDKKYTERGTVKILRAESIAAARDQRY